MRIWIQGMRICQYQLRILSRNYKVYTIPVCMLIFMKNTLVPLIEFMASVNEKATPYLLPFLFGDSFLTALMFAGVLLFYIDAPFYDKHQLFVIMRSGVPTWCLGQILYVITISILYMCFLTIMSFLMLFPRIFWSGEWGKIWTTLAITDVGSSSGIPFGVSESIIFGYSPVQAMLTVFLLGFLICSFYGFCMWCLNVYVGKMISLVVVLASVCLVTRVQYLPSWVMYFVPSAWADLGNLSEYAFHRISVSRAIVILITGSILFAGLVFWKTVKSDIAK